MCTRLCCFIPSSKTYVIQDVKKLNDSIKKQPNFSTKIDSNKTQSPSEKNNRNKTGTVQHVENKNKSIEIENGADDKSSQVTATIEEDATEKNGSARLTYQEVRATVEKENRNTTQVTYQESKQNEDDVTNTYEEVKNGSVDNVIKTKVNYKEVGARGEKDNNEKGGTSKATYQETATAVGKATNQKNGAKKVTHQETATTTEENATESNNTTKVTYQESKENEDDGTDTYEEVKNGSIDNVNKTNAQNENTVPPERRPGVIPLPTSYDNKSIQKIKKYSKDSKDEKLIKEAIEKNEFLNKILKGKLLKDVVDAMYKRDITSKEVIIKEGEKGSHMYVSAKGRYEVSVKGKGVVNIFDDVRVFGELAILYNAKRNATIKAIKPGRVWVLDRSVYQTLMVHSNIKEQDELLAFLEKVPNLNAVGRNVLQKVAGLLVVEYFPAGKEIVRQGEEGDKIYIIRAGTVTVTKDNEVYGTLGKDKYFGELALLKREPRQATVTANAPGVECLSLQREHFLEHFEVEGNRIITVPNVRKLSDVHENMEYADIHLNDLDVVATLGVGGFGRVELAQYRQKPELTFALKYLKKIDMVEQNQQEHVRNERNIQKACRSKFIIRLYRSYRDRKYIYFLMESCLGGDLWTLLQRQKLHRFDEKAAKFMAGCVLEAFAYLHERGIVYRDLKPENLLIDEKGYIKLTDFGFAKKLGDRGKTFTFAGTPEYVAPEIILNRGHDKAVDYWEFGIFIFELLTGRTPFRTNDSSHMRTYNRILSGIDNVEFPQYVSNKAKDIIKKLLEAIPTQRLGCKRTGVEDVRNHRWFLGFDWNKLREGKIAAPWVPTLKSKIDTKYFEKFKKDTDNPPDETSGWDKDF